MTSNIRHSIYPSLMNCWFDGSRFLDAPGVDPTTAPHDCMMPDCPGPVNKRKLEAFDDMLAGTQRLVPGRPLAPGHRGSRPSVAANPPLSEASTDAYHVARWLRAGELYRGLQDPV